MEKNLPHKWITFEKKIKDLEVRKTELTKKQEQYQEEVKSTILDALLKNDFNTIHTLTEHLRMSTNEEIITIDNKIQFLRDRQQKVRSSQEKDSEYDESILKDDAMYIHALETGDQRIIELFKQRKISEELYQALMDTYYGNIFDASKSEWWKVNYNKVKLVSSDEDVGGTLQQMGIEYNNVRVEEFYEPDAKWWKSPAIKPSKQINFIKEWNIIQELFIYIQAKNVPFDSSEIVLNRKWTTMYIHIQWMDKTVVISNVYWVWTHIYQWRVDIKEIQNGTIGWLCKRYHGKKINFWSDFWWIEWWKCRFIKTLGEEITSTVVPEKEETVKVPEKKYRTLREKIKYFSSGKHISRNDLNFEDEYEAIVTSKKTYKNWYWTRMYMSIWEGIFGFCCYRNSKDANHISIWSIVKVKLNRIWWKKSPIVFTRPEKLCMSN